MKTNNTNNMELSNQQSQTILYNNVKRKCIKKRYRTSTKFKWKCLNCMKPLFISYNCYGRNAIFCKECFSLYQNKKTVAQYHYMKKLKDQQVLFFENYMDDFIDIQNKLS